MVHEHDQQREARENLEREARFDEKRRQRESRRIQKETRIIRICSDARDFCHSGSRREFVEGWAPKWTAVATLIEEVGRKRVHETLKLPEGDGYLIAAGLLRDAANLGEEELANDLESHLEWADASRVPEERTLLPLRSIFDYVQECLLQLTRESRGVPDPEPDDLRNAHAELAKRDQDDELAVEEVKVLLGLDDVDTNAFARSSKYFESPRHGPKATRLPMRKAGQSKGKGGIFQATRSWSVVEVRAFLYAWASELEIRLGPF